MPRDPQKRRVFAAERAHPERNDDRPTWAGCDEARSYAQRVVASPAFVRLVGPHPTKQVWKVEIRQEARNQRKAYWHYWLGNVGVISLPRWARQPIVVLHELAHGVMAIRDPTHPSHGPRFVRVLFTLIRDFMGIEAGKTYLDQCDANGVKIDWDWEVKLETP